MTISEAITAWAKQNGVQLKTPPILEEGSITSSGDGLVFQSWSIHFETLGYSEEARSAEHRALWPNPRQELLPGEEK